MMYTCVIIQVWTRPVVGIGSVWKEDAPARTTSGNIQGYGNHIVSPLMGQK